MCRAEIRGGFDRRFPPLAAIDTPAKAAAMAPRFAERFGHGACDLYATRPVI
jgi:hypothetical protein